LGKFIRKGKGSGTESVWNRCLTLSPFGGILNLAGTMAVCNCNISGNSATSDFGSGTGGGISNDGTLTVRDSIISGNFATKEGNGFFNDGTLTVRNSILFGNYADQVGGGIANLGTLTLKGSTLLGNDALLDRDLYNGGVLSLYDSIIGDLFP